MAKRQTTRGYGCALVLVIGVVGGLMLDQQTRQNRAPAATTAPVIQHNEDAEARLLEALDAMPGVISVDAVSVIGSIVDVEMTVAEGYDVTGRAESVLRLTGAILVDASLDFTVILWEGGATATAYAWDNETDTFRLTEINR